MIWTIARKEFLTSLLAYRFGVGLILCLASVTAGTLAAAQDYRSRKQAFEQAVQQYEQQLKREGTYGRLVFALQAFREPRRMAVFSVGSDRWQGNEVLVTHHHVPDEARWLGAANPYLAIFRCIDVTQVVAFVLGLLAFLSSHDAICGEREEGTLRMVLANRVARDQVLLGKAAGHLGVLGVILLAGYLAAVLVVQASLHSLLSGPDLARLGVMLLVSALYVAALYFAGLYLSAATARSATSLVLAVAAWAVAVVTFPPAVNYAVGQLTPMQAATLAAEAGKADLDQQFERASSQLLQATAGGPGGASAQLGGTGAATGIRSIWDLFQGGSASNENGITGYIDGRFDTHESFAQMARDWQPRIAAQVAGLRGRGQIRAAEAIGAATRGDWDTFAAREADLREAGIPWRPPLAPAELERRVALLRRFFPQRERLRIDFAERVFTEAWLPVERRMRSAGRWTRLLGLLSPAGAYQDVAAILARTDRGDYWRFLDETRAYRRQLIGHYEEQGWFAAREWFNDQAGTVKLVGLPRFRQAPESLWEALARARASLGVLAGSALAAFLAAYARFRRADVR
ncbi:MAG: ABC transporter permease subunit [Candidatus Latescibacterota bacterium]